MRPVATVRGWFAGSFGPCLRATLTFHLTIDALGVVALAVAVATGLLRLTETLPLILAGGVGRTAFSGFEAWWKCYSYRRMRHAEDQPDVYG